MLAADRGYASFWAKLIALTGLQCFGSTQWDVATVQGTSARRSGARRDTAAFVILRRLCLRSKRRQTMLVVAQSRLAHLSHSFE